MPNGFYPYLHICQYEPTYWRMAVPAALRDPNNADIHYYDIGAKKCTICGEVVTLGYSLIILQPAKEGQEKR